MPSVKQGGGYTLTFSKKNEDIKELLIEKRKIKGFVLTDYICDAIRFFEANKDEKKEITNINIEELVKQEVAKILSNIPIKVENEEVNEKTSTLEKNLDDVDIDED
ncbi:hypothetical protein [Clostridium sp. SGI.024]|uniref:hypothetical protein n=1 Tax=Clostridium sp. SGI.024 TaxID=3420551 RepID=UPI003D002160